MIELERTYLAKRFPNNLKKCQFKEIIDIYIPSTSIHPKLRLRKNGNKFEFTKKEPINGKDASQQKEQTIILNKTEFNALNRQLTGKIIHKLRYYYKYNNLTAEVDIFQDDLEGLVTIDFEFKTLNQKNNFQAPPFCLTEITQESFIAGGMLCGKTYNNIKNNLNKFNYHKLYL